MARQPRRQQLATALLVLLSIADIFGLNLERVGDSTGRLEGI